MRAWLWPFPACALLLTAAQALGQRDPTAPPAAERALPAAPTPGQAGTGGVSNAGPIGIIVRDGTRYLVVGTRLLASGQMLGSARIERISETEVWLREGGELRRVQQFAGIVRRADPDLHAAPPCPPVGPASRVSRVAKSASAPRIEAIEVSCAIRPQ